MYSPVNGKVIEINNELDNKPELVNLYCYRYWLIKIGLLNNEFDLDEFIKNIKDKIKEHKIN